MQLNLSDEHVQLILNALAELPLKVSANAYSEIMRQVQQQQRPPPDNVTPLPERQEPA